MAARIWKKILFVVLIIACLFNIVYKLVRKLPLVEELKTSAQYIMNKENEKK